MNAKETASPDASAMVTLLVRTDTGVFRLHLGEGAAEFAASLSNGHCFQVLPVFALPLAPEGTPNSVAAFVVECGGACLGNGWFSGIAIDTLAAFMVRACIPGGSQQCGALNQSPREMPRAGEPDPFPEASTRCANITGSRPDSPGNSGDSPHAPTDGEPERVGDSGEDEHMSEEEDEGVVDEIWWYVEASPAAEADKAVDIRMALEHRLGKLEAKRLLACTRATVAKQGGHKNRILRIGRTALKMRRAIPS